MRVNFQLAGPIGGIDNTTDYMPDARLRIGCKGDGIYLSMTHDLGLLSWLARI